MAIARTHHKKAPNQNPAGFFKLEQFGGARPTGGSQKVGDKLTGGPQREKVMGRKSLG